MNDMSSVIVPKSDQINSDDLIGGDMLITIRDVKITGGQEQPVSIYFDGSDKAYRPCKSMSRVLVAAWGPDAKKYVGRSLQLYRDPTVKWGGMEVGGIRIRAMTDIQRDMTMALTATKGSRKPYTVKPLAIAAQTQRAAAPAQDAAEKWAAGYVGKLATFTQASALETFAAEKASKLAELAGARPDLHAQVVAALAQRRAELEPKAPTFEDDFGLSPQPSTSALEVPAEEDAAPPNQAPIEKEAAPQQGGSLVERMSNVAKGGVAGRDPDVPAFLQEGRADSDMGEAPTLDQAKAAIDGCASEDAVQTMLDSYRGQLSDEDLTALSGHAGNIVAERWPA